MMNFLKKHAKAILIVVAIALAIILIVGMIVLHGGKEDPTFATHSDENTVPATTETLPDDSFATNDGTGTTLPDDTEPDVTTPVATTPAPTTPKPTEPTPTTPKPTEPVETTPKPTEPAPTTPKPTEPAHKHSYTSKVTKEATCTATGTKTFTCSCGDTYTETIKATGHNYTTKVVAPTTSAQGYTLYTCSGCGESYKDNYTDKLPEETKPSDPFNGVTPNNISVSNTAGWTNAMWTAFEAKYPLYKMTTAQMRAYYIAYYDDYDCGVVGHDCMNSSEHVKFTRPCKYCGLTLGCVGRICTDEYGFTYCDDKHCYSYDIKLDPSRYCQTCGKPTSTSIERDPTKMCNQTIGGGGSCVYCGIFVPGNTCHTCKQSDIDAYN